MKRIIATSVFAGMAAAAAAQQTEPPAERYTLRGEYLYWSPKLGSTEFQKGSGGKAGTLIDAVENLAVQDDTTFAVKGTLKLGSHFKLRGSWTPLKYDGDVVITKNITFGATTFDRLGRVVTSLRGGGLYTGELEWDLTSVPKAYVGLLAGAKVFDVDYLMVAPSSGKREQVTERVPIPVVGIVGRTYSGRLSFSFDASGMTLGSKSVFEMDLGAQLHLSDRLAVKGGYRYLYLKSEDGLDSIRSSLGGWHFGVELSI